MAGMRGVFGHLYQPEALKRYSGWHVSLIFVLATNACAYFMSRRARRPLWLLSDQQHRRGALVKHYRVRPGQFWDGNIALWPSLAATVLLATQCGNTSRFCSADRKKKNKKMLFRGEFNFLRADFVPASSLILESLLRCCPQSIGLVLNYTAATN